MLRINQTIDRARAERGNAQATHLKPMHPERHGDSPPQTSAIPAASDVIHFSTWTTGRDPVNLRARRVLTDVVNAPAAAAYKALRTHVLQRKRASRWNTVGIKGARKGNDKSLTTIRFGISLGREVNQTVLLGDLLLRCPRLASYLVAEKLAGIRYYFRVVSRFPKSCCIPGCAAWWCSPDNELVLNSSAVLYSPKVAD